MRKTLALLMLLLLAIALGAAAAPAAEAAQAKPAASRPADAAPAPVDEQNARDTRERLHQILQQYPPSVAQVLRLDSSLLGKPEYMATYPMLAAYIAQHPEVAHNPVFFLGGPGGPQFSDLHSPVASSVQSIFIGMEF